MSDTKAGTPSDPLLDIPVKETDLGNCTRFIRDWAFYVRYVPAWKSWAIWDGTRWVVDDKGLATELAKRTVRGILREASYAETDEERKALVKHHQRSEAAARIFAMLDLARSEPGVPVEADVFDANPWMLNVANGTIDLQTGTLGPHQARQLMTKRIDLAYDSSAGCPQWLAFLDQIMAGKADLVRFLQKAIGYALTGLTREQVLFILFGGGANGKSTFLNTISALLGEYARQTPIETFMQKQHDTINNDIARLHGARFVAAAEAEAQRRLAESLIKLLTGGEKITARFLHKEFFEFTPRFKIFLATNHKPFIRGGERAIWRRIRLIPFTVTIADEQQDKDLPTKLEAELPGILAWAVEGARLWLTEGLGMPDDVRIATESYRAEMDVIGDFIEDCCDRGPTLTATAKALYGAYTTWCQNSGEKPMSQKAFGTALRERGYVNDKAKHGVFWTGLAVHYKREPGDESGEPLTAVSRPEIGF